MFGPRILNTHTQKKNDRSFGDSSAMPILYRLYREQSTDLYKTTQAIIPLGQRVMVVKWKLSFETRYSAAPPVSSDDTYPSLQSPQDWSQEQRLSSASAQSRALESGSSIGFITDYINALYCV